MYKPVRQPYSKWCTHILLPCCVVLPLKNNFSDVVSSSHLKVTLAQSGFVSDSETWVEK